MKPEMQIEKGHYGVKVKSMFDLNNGRKLKVLTMKFHNGIGTHATAIRYSPAGASGFEMEEWGSDDYGKTVMMHLDVKRATEKAMIAAHEKAIEEVLGSGMIDEVNEFYAAKEARKKPVGQIVFGRIAG